MKFRRASLSIKGLCFFVSVAFIATLILADIYRVKDSVAQVNNITVPAGVLPLSDDYSAPLLKGMRIDSKNPLSLEFIVDSANGEINDQDTVKELVAYFLVALTVPQNDLWVNLSPYEEDRVLPDSLQKTELGKTFLAQDYILKQLSASLTYPDTELGKKYWDSELALNSYNKIWIKAEKADIYENNGLALIKDSSLKVMTEKDYLALEKLAVQEKSSDNKTELLIPQISQQVNSSKHFAKLRQLYSALILATWFKGKLRDSFYGQFIDQNKTKGQELADKSFNQSIYNDYLDSVKEGVYKIVRKEEQKKGTVKKEYFSGGNTFIDLNEVMDISSSIQGFKEPIGAISSSIVDLKPLKAQLDLKEADVLIFAGPSGAGKTTFIKRLLEQSDQYYMPDLTTTRPARQGATGDPFREFVSSEYFDFLDTEEKLLMVRESHGFKYGLKKENVLANKVMILDTASMSSLERIKSTFPKAKAVLVSPVKLNTEDLLDEDALAEVVRSRIASREGVSKEEENKRVQEGIDSIKSFANNIDDFSLVVETEALPDSPEFDELFNVKHESFFKELNKIYPNSALVRGQSVQWPSMPKQIGLEDLPAYFKKVTQTLRAEFNYLNTSNIKLPVIESLELFEETKLSNLVLANFAFGDYLANEISNSFGSYLSYLRLLSSDYEDTLNIQDMVKSEINNAYVMMKSGAENKLVYKRLPILIKRKILDFEKLNRNDTAFFLKYYLFNLHEKSEYYFDQYQNMFEKVSEIYERLSELEKEIHQSNSSSALSEDGYGRQELVDERADYALDLALALEERAFDQDKAMRLAENIASLRLASIKIREEFFVGNWSDIYEGRITETMMKQFIKKYQSQLAKYQETGLDKEDVEILLLDNLVPLQWYTDLIEDGYNHEMAMEYLQENDNPISRWKHTFRYSLAKPQDLGISRANSIKFILSFRENFLSSWKDIVRVLDAIKEVYGNEESISYELAAEKLIDWNFGPEHLLEFISFEKITDDKAESLKSVLEQFGLNDQLKISSSSTGKKEFSELDSKPVTAYEELSLIFHSALDNVYQAYELIKYGQNDADESESDETILQGVQLLAQTSAVLKDDLKRHANDNDKLIKLFFYTVDAAINYNYEEGDVFDSTFDIKTNLGKTEMWEEFYEDSPDMGEMMLGKIQAELETNILFALESLVDILEHFPEDTYKKLDEAGFIIESKYGGRTKTVIDMHKAVASILGYDYTKKSSSSVGGLDFADIDVETTPSSFPVKIEGIDAELLRGFTFSIRSQKEIKDIHEIL